MPTTATKPTPVDLCLAVKVEWSNEGIQSRYTCGLPAGHDCAHEQRDGRGRLLFRWGVWSR